MPGQALAAFDQGSMAFAIIGSSSKRNVWAFNQMTGAWLRRNGCRWSEGLVSRLTGASAIGITSTLVLGAGEIWAFGARVNGYGDVVPFAARFDGRRWKVTPIPRLLNLLVSAASAVSPRDIWAVIGRGGQAVFPPSPSGGALAHWDGRRWRLMQLPARLASRGDPTGIAALSDRDIWVTGGTQNGKLGLTETAARWDGRKWRTATLPAAASRARCVLGSIVAGGVLLAAAWFVRASIDGLPTSVPSCSWPLRVRGPATSEQAGLIRCYLRALAAQDQGALLAVADTANTPIRITHADFAHAADARSGTATATFTPNQDDTADIGVTIAFADRARQAVDMHAANPSSAHSWRLDIGTAIVSSGGPPAPPPASPSP